MILLKKISVIFYLRNMNHKKILNFISLLIISLSFNELKSQVNDKYVLKYNQPASHWYEALPVGNGRLGAMVFGNFNKERIQLNEESLWGGSSFDRNNPNSLKYLKKIQGLIFDGKIVEAEELAGKYMLGTPTKVRSYQTLGDLSIDYLFNQRWFPSRYNRSYPIFYNRNLNLHNGVANSEFKIGNNITYQKVFSSAVDDVIVVDISFSEPSNVSFKLSRGINIKEEDDLDFDPSNHLNIPGWKGDYNDSTFKIEYDNGDDWVNFTGQIIDYPTEKEGPGGNHMKFASVLKVHSTDGEIETLSQNSNAKINIINATHVTLIFTGDTDYNINKLNFDRSIDPLIVSKSKIAKVSLKPKTQIILDHLTDHRELFDRVDINLGKDKLSHLATDQRLALIKQNEDNKDPGLVELYYQFGRYLLMGSSRFPGKLPANLQGIWNDLFKAPWDADFHANINLQMNYWPAEMTNLSETLLPLNNFLKELTVPGSRTAKKMYGAKGWTMHHLTNPFGKTSVGDGVHGLTPLNGAWMTFPLFRHFEFNQDLNYLKNEAFPIIKGSVEFVLDYLIESPEGYLVTNPSSSPENHFFIPGVEQKVELSYMPTVDKQIIEMLFDIFIESAEILDIDRSLVRKVKNAKKRLPPYQISKFGTLQEWIKDYEEQQPGHRHISHLLGVYPFGNLTKESPVIFEAAKKSVARRLSFGGGHTGWSRAWIIGLYARFFDSKKAYQNLYELLRKSTLKNLFDTHRPFQIDGNFGGTAAIHEMIIQSTKDDIILLPATPKVWNDGHLHGSKVRGGAIVNLDWKNGKPSRFEIISKEGGDFNIIFKEKQIPLKLKSGQSILLSENDFN